MVNFQGDIYCANPDGCVFEFIAPAKLIFIARVSPIEGDDIRSGSYLVESAGELLLVRHVNLSLKVFRVNVEHKLLEEVKSLGGRALFLGAERCVSVDADKLPSLDGDHIYMFDLEDNWDICVCNLRGDIVDIIANDHYLDQPFSLVQVLLRFCDFHQML
jgi:hypothetical protein